MRNRVILIGLTIAIWAALKMIDRFVTGPELIFLLLIALALMATHSIWLYSAQSEWQKKARRHLKTRLKNAVGKLIAKKRFKSSTGADLSSFEKSSWNPQVDIFISAKNEANAIENTVRNLFKLDYEKFFVWVIDDCSDDDMPQILEKLQEEYENLKVVRREPGSYPGKSAALNDALAMSKGEVVAVFDADAYVAPDFLNKVLPVLAPENVGAVQAQKRIYEHQKGVLVECQASEYAMDTYFQVGRDIIGGAVELRGNGELIKRQALIDVGGWNNKTLTDDLDLSMRLLVSNWDIKFCPHAHVFEEGVTKLKGLLRQRRRWAEGSIRRYLDYIFPLNSPSRLSLVERIDTLAFTVYFVVPALMILETTSELMRFVTGVPTYGSFLALIAIAVFCVSQLNIIVSNRIYRNLSFWEAFTHSFIVNAYIYAHWIPCIVISFGQILFGKGSSTWHRTDHIGHSTQS